MNFSLIRKSSTADGPGLRTSVYFSGCQRALEGNACPGCHNSVAWAQDSGFLWTPELQEEVLNSIAPSYIKGLSILGGEPFSDFNLDGVLELVKACRERFGETKDIWIWSGYWIEESLTDGKKKSRVEEILKRINVLVDGPFIQEQKIPDLKYRGSTNQRVLKIIKNENSIEWEDISNTI